jgi:hypothetical protein
MNGRANNLKASVRLPFSPAVSERFRLCCRIWLNGIKTACGGANVAESVVPLACPLGRSRLLRAAWRPCSRGPARRALWSTSASADRLAGPEGVVGKLDGDRQYEVAFTWGSRGVPGPLTRTMLG